MIGHQPFGAVRRSGARSERTWRRRDLLGEIEGLVGIAQDARGGGVDAGIRREGVACIGAEDPGVHLGALRIHIHDGVAVVDKVHIADPGIEAADEGLEGCRGGIVDVSADAAGNALGDADDFVHVVRGDGGADELSAEREAGGGVVADRVGRDVAGVGGVDVSGEEDAVANWVPGDLAGDENVADQRGR